MNSASVVYVMRQMLISLHSADTLITWSAYLRILLYILGETARTVVPISMNMTHR